MDKSIAFLLTAFSLSILLYAISGILTASFVIPLQLKQAGVKNGLFKLRKQMLLKGFLSFIISVISIIILSTRFFDMDVAITRYFISILIVVHASGILAKAIIDFEIYHQQYTPENKKLHEKIAKFENAEIAKQKKLTK